MSNIPNEISNTQDVIDSRDIITRIEYLENLSENNIDGDGKEELKNLKALAKEASDSPDWEYGETLINETYFEEYAQELAEDIGAIDRDAKWPMNCIDWEQAAKELKYDYMAVDFDGQTYYIRG